VSAWPLVISLFSLAFPPLCPPHLSFSRSLPLPLPLPLSLSLPLPLPRFLSLVPYDGARSPPDLARTLRCCQGDIRGGTSRGRLLGPSGQTIRALQQESHCKMQIKGRGSIKLREGCVMCCVCVRACMGVGVCMCACVRVCVCICVCVYFIAWCCVVGGNTMSVCVCVCVCVRQCHARICARVCLESQ